ncbi:heavy metal-associated domain-containing protein, partial [Acinetobacter baumannii]
MGTMIRASNAGDIERFLRHKPGVLHVTVDSGKGDVTIRFDDSTTTPDALKNAIVLCSYHCRGEALPNHPCSASDSEVPASQAQQPE